MTDIGTFGFQWHVTDRCLGRCRHCYQDRFDGGAELPVDKLKNIADRIMAFLRDVPVSINLTGGEPLLYDGLFELAAHASSFGNIDEFNIITSTRGMDAVTVGKLKSIPKLTSVKVSLESDDPQINDDIRGAGHFEMTTRNIRALSEAGLSVVVMATLGKRNYHTVKNLCEYAASIGARGIILERYVPLGQGANLSEDVLTSREWTDIISAVICVAAANDLAVSDLLPYRAFRLDMPRGVLGDQCGLGGAACDLGPSSMALMPDGTVYPCRRCPVPVGKLPDDDMGHVIKSLSQYAAHRQKCYAFDF